MRPLKTLLLSIAFLSLLAPVARAAGDPRKGADVFAEECGDCHSVTPGRNKKGPAMAGVGGRKAGTVAEYQGYSDAMKQAGWTWSAEKLDAYITQPRKALPGGKMKYDGLSDANARADVIAYVLSLK